MNSVDSSVIFLGFLILALCQLAIVVCLWRFASADADSENQARAMEILGRAYKKARQILGAAELEEVKLTAQSKIETKKFTAEAEREIDINREKLEQAFLVEADAAYEKFADYLTKLTAAAPDALARFQKEASKRTEAELEEYKKARMAKFEADLPLLLEQVLALVLPKTIKVRDQVDLINEALEKAKAEKWI